MACRTAGAASTGRERGRTGAARQSLAEDHGAADVRRRQRWNSHRHHRSERKEASFRLLFDSHPLPMFLWDRNTFKYLAVNAAACRHYGYSHEQFMKMTSLDIRSKEDQELLRKTVATAAPGDVRSDRVWRHIKADGTPIDVIIYAKMLPHDGHLATLSVAVDVTERRQAEKELRRTRSFLDAVVENMPAILFVKE